MTGTFLMLKSFCADEAPSRAVILMFVVTGALAIRNTNKRTVKPLSPKIGGSETPCRARWRYFWAEERGYVTSVSVTPAASGFAAGDAPADAE